MNFKNKTTTLTLMMFCSLASMAQVGIGTTTPNTNAALDLESTTQGMLFPRITTAQRDAIASPAKGLTIFNTDFNFIQTNISTTSTANWKNWSFSITGCYAKISAVVYKDFLCHNLGADISLDPHTPVVGLQGGYIQWGRRGPNTTGDSRIDWQTAGNTGNFAAAPTSGSANGAAISGWSTNEAANGSWGGIKTADDPCPSGYRVPTISEWTEVNSKNTISRTGTFSTSATNYGVALHYGLSSTSKLLTLPITGFRNNLNGEIGQRGSYGYYWSSEDNGGPNYLGLNQNTSGIGSSVRISAFPLRCIAIDNPSTNGTAVVSGYSCSAGSTGFLRRNVAASGATQTITANVTAVGTYSIFTTKVNGVTFIGSGTFTVTGAQNVVLTATGTPSTGNANFTFTLNTSTTCNFMRYVSF
jgi:uncharacterized protein (TIGR02145 family)